MKHKTFYLFNYVRKDGHRSPNMTSEFDQEAAEALRNDVALFGTSKHVISITGNPQIITCRNGYEYRGGYVVWYEELE